MTPKPEDRQQARELLRPLHDYDITPVTYERTIEGIASALTESRASSAADERRYIIEQIRANATEITFFAGGRALDLLAWILELPEAGKRTGAGP